MVKKSKIERPAFQRHILSSSPSRYNAVYCHIEQCLENKTISYLLKKFDLQVTTQLLGIVERIFVFGMYL